MSYNIGREGEILPRTKAKVPSTNELIRSLEEPFRRKAKKSLSEKAAGADELAALQDDYDVFIEEFSGYLDEVTDALDVFNEDEEDGRKLQMEEDILIWLNSLWSDGGREALPYDSLEAVQKAKGGNQYNASAFAETLKAASKEAAKLGCDEAVVAIDAALESLIGFDLEAWMEQAEEESKFGAD